jgi:2-polyprenyl-3-methyl-5-hydroxy-6-metoxy-1,4-benzoquinol methylase
MSAIDFHHTEAVRFDEKYNTRPDFRERWTIWKVLLDRYFSRGNAVLDAGCGSGLFSFHLATNGCLVTGIDGAEGMIQLCREKATQEGLQQVVRFEKAKLPDDLPQFSRPDGWDGIISSSVLEYIPDAEGTIRAFHNMLHPGGICIVSLPNASSLYRRMERLAFKWTGKPAYYQHVRHIYTTAAWNRIMQDAGFGPVEMVFYAGNNPLSRFLSRFLSPAHWQNMFAGVYQKL